MKYAVSLKFYGFTTVKSEKYLTAIITILKRVLRKNILKFVMSNL